MASNSWVKHYKWLLVALLLGGVIRGVFLFAFFDDFQQDPDGYRQIAENLVNENVYGQSFDGGIQPTAYRPPLYPLLLSFLVTERGSELRAGNEPDWSLDLGSVAILHLILSVASMFFAFLWATSLGLGGLAAGAVALLVALDPIGLRQSSLVMTETLAVFCATFGLCLVTRLFTGKASPLYSFACGLLFGVFALCRPTFLIWGGLVFMALAVRALRAESSTRKEQWIRAVGLLLGIAIAVSPWMVRNQLVLGKPVFATTHGGYTIFLGNNDSFYDYLQSGSMQVWDGEAELQPIVAEIRNASRVMPADKTTGIDEVKKDRLYYNKSIEVIKRRPGDFAYACLIRVVRFWSVIPNLPAPDRTAEASSPAGRSTGQQVIRVGSAIWYSGLFLCAVWGSYRLARSRFAGDGLAGDGLAGDGTWARVYPALLLVVAFQGLHVVYWSNMRMRAPLVVLIAVLAVLAFTKRKNESDGVARREEIPV